MTELHVGFGVTALNRGRRGTGIDGLGHYCQALRRSLALRRDLTLQSFEFSASAVAEPGEAVFAAGDFQRQAAAALAVGGFATTFPRLDALEADVIHAPDHLVPRLRHRPVVATLMDAIPVSHPEWVSFPFKRLRTAAWRRSMAWAERIITISNYSRDAIAEHFAINPERIDVVPLGVDDHWFKAPSQAGMQAVQQRFDLPDHYFLFVGTLQPRKNLDRLLAAHASLPSEIRQAHPLVIVGQRGWGVDDLVTKLQASKDRHVRWLNYVPQADMVPLFAGASAMVYPSLLEGFGLPVLEAFATGIPVVAAGTTAIPEIAGDAALLVDPLDVDALADAMQTLVENRELARQLVQAGLARARTYTWSECAALTRQSYARAL